MDASGALDSLLGRLTSILVEEAQLLGRVRGDVEFIKEEMECMNSLILQITEAQHRDHLVRAWMKQVVGLTRDCEGNVDHYIHYVGSRPGDDDGLLGHLRRILRFLRTIPVRHRIATRIRELKVHARDVGDRRQRYGVTVPHAEPHQLRVITTRMSVPPQAGGPQEEEDLQRRELLYGEPPDTIDKGTERVLGWLSEELKATNNDLEVEHRLRIRIGIIGDGAAGKTAIARRVYQHHSIVSSFDLRVWVNFGGAIRDPEEILLDILKQTRAGSIKLETYLEGKKCLIILDDTLKADYCLYVLHNEFFRHFDCAVIYTGTSRVQFGEWYRQHVFDVIQEEGTRPWFFRNRAFALANKFEPVENVLRRCYSDAFAMQILLHLLYVNPNLSGDEILSSLDCNKNSIAKGMLMFCYNQLPVNYKSCLLYLSIFPRDHIIRRTSLLRRWISEGLIAETRTITEKDKTRYEISTLQDQAERICDALVTHGFLRPCETSHSGKIKSCTMHHIVHEFITTDVSIVDISLPSHLAHRVSVNGGAIALQESSSTKDEASDDLIQTLLEFMPQSPQWPLLKVLDLEGCTGLKNNKHMKNICKILLLRYLSLRNTDVTGLPKQIEKLQCLETLDIRQTAIRGSSTKSMMFPMIRYFLAGQTVSPSNILDRFQESFATVCIPSAIRRMKRIEVMSHVEVSGNVDVLMDIGKLLHLRKLGVVLLHGRKDVLNVLFQQIEKLNNCLRSLSIQINKQVRSGSSPDAEAVPDLVNPPILLESLNICGLKSGLPRWVAYLDRLSKITLQDTFVGEDAIHLLGKLRLLRCLRLLHKSYTQSKLNFEADEFQRLRFLVIEGSNILNISFADGAAPKVELILWSFSTFESLSGVNHLPKLKKLELNGKCSLDQIEAQLKDHPNHPVLNHSPEHQHQADVAAASASCSSAP